MTGRLRIISGQWRGRKIPVVDRPGLRPTGDRARETLFNWLQGSLVGARCLDLFAGSGALGLEAASRGAGEVVLIERDRGLARALDELVSGWPGADRVRVVNDDALAWLKTDTGQFDIVFIDPPFEAGLQQRTLEVLVERDRLSPGARVYVEAAADESFDHGLESLPGFEVDREKRLGAVGMLLLRYTAGDRPAL